MLVRTLLVTLLLSAFGGCGDSDANVIARIQWRLNYRDWTDSDLEDQFRDCANQPEGRYAGVDENPYPGVQTVRVFIEDPEGQVPNAEKEFNCEAGINSNTVEILSMVRQSYDITVEAKDAAGNILYRHKEEEVDLSVLTTHSYELKTVTSEGFFFPVFGSEGSFDCPDTVKQLRVSFFHPEDQNTPEAGPAFEYTSAQACSSGTSDQIYVRGVPVAPVEGTNGKYNPTTYSLRAETLGEGGEPLHCGWTTSPQAFRPGDNTNGIKLRNIKLNEGPCT